MHPTIDLDLFELPLYSAWLVLGMWVGLGVAYAALRVRSRRTATAAIFLDGALLICIAGWIGARAYHVVLNWDYYAARPDEIAQVGLGGLAMRGALVTGLIALAIYARVRKLRLGRLLDAAVLGLALGQAIGWVGALVEGANYGVVSDSQFALELPDIYGLVAPRFPLQHAEIGLFTLLFVGLLILAGRELPAGRLFIVYLLIASTANFILGFGRGDATLWFGALRADQVVDALFAVGASGWWLFEARVAIAHQSHQTWDKLG